MSKFSYFLVCQSTRHWSLTLNYEAAYIKQKSTAASFYQDYSVNDRQKRNALRT
jgi:hypothetical protein